MGAAQHGKHTLAKDYRCQCPLCADYRKQESAKAVARRQARRTYPAVSREPQHGKRTLARNEMCPCNLCTDYRKRDRAAALERHKRRHLLDPEGYSAYKVERTRQWRINNPEKVREANARDRESGVKRAAARKWWAQRTPEEREAHYAVSRKRNQARRDAGYTWVPSEHSKERMKNRVRAMQAATQETAFRSGEPWTAEEDAALMSRELPCAELAFIWGRTLGAMYRRRHVLLQELSRAF